VISENLRPIRRFEISLKSNFHVKLSAISPLKICVISTREFTQRNYIYVSKKPAVRDFKFVTRLFKYSTEMCVSFLYVGYLCLLLVHLVFAEQLQCWNQHTCNLYKRKFQYYLFPHYITDTFLAWQPFSLKLT
jgi:hypothetical protein